MASHALKGGFALKGNYTYRLRYEKTPAVRYISHLDFVRVLNRTVRRSGLPVTYTEGFNPHPVMMVAMPLSVGVTSEDEYIDIVIKQLEILDPKIIVNRITSDPDKDTLLEPVWLTEKCQLLNDIDKEMKKRNTYQGINL